MDNRNEDMMLAEANDQQRVYSEAENPEPPAALITSMDNVDAGASPTIDKRSGLPKQEEAEGQTLSPALDDQLRTPTSEYPSTVPTPVTPWTSQELPQHTQDLQLLDPRNVPHLSTQNDCYFAIRAAPNSETAEYPTATSTSTLSSESRASSIPDKLDSVSAPQSPGTDWRECSSRETPSDIETPRPASLPAKPNDTHSRTHPNYPNQSFAALQAQYIPPHYPRPRPLRTRSSHPSQHQSYSADASRRSREISSTSGVAKTAGNTPAHSPGLFSPTFSSNRSAEEHEDGQYNTPLLHPSHMQAPKETHKLLKDIDPISGRKLVNNYELQKKLGSGQHGTVKLGRNLETNEKVAVKIVRRFSKKLRLGKAGDPSDMIKKEVAILKKARHPHVVSLLEVIDDDEFGKVYLVLEFVERGEIVWRKQTDRDVAAFEMQRTKRETSDQFDEAYEVAEIERFNGTAPARQLENARLLAEQKLQAENLLKAKTSAGRRPIPSSDSYWSLEYGGIEDEQASEAGSLPKTKSKESLRSPASDIQSHGDSVEGSPQSSTFLEPGTPKRPSDPSNAIEHPTVADLKRESRPASPVSLEGTMYGPYTSDERSSDVALKATLDQIISRQSKWTEEEEQFMFVPCLTISQALDAFRDTVLGLEYLHYQGIIHRDIKPANLLWTKDRRVKISDFGVSYLGKPIREDDNKEEIPEADAADLDEALELAKTVGTPAFYAPELCDPKLFDFSKNPERPQITGQIDVWALGVTLYGMIFGRLPFFDANEFAMYEKIARQEVFIPRMRLKGVEVADPDSEEHSVYVPMNSNKRDDDVVEYEEVDDDLRDLLKRLLHKQPTKRISLKEVKHHPWVLRGIKDPSAWINETDPSLQSQGRRIEVSTQDVEGAVVGLTIVDRIKSGIRRLGSVVRGRERDSRKRGNSNAKAPDPTSPAHPSQPITFPRDWRRSSLRGDEQITSALRASREGPEHPLSHSLAASPEPKSAKDYFDGSVPKPPDAASERPSLGERMLSTAESTKTIRAPVPPTVREDSATSDESFSPNTHVVDTGSSSSLGGIFSGAGRRFVNGMRSRERVRDSHSPSQSSRSSSVDPNFNHVEDPHASPSIAYSSAVAAGHVDQPPILHEDASLNRSVPLERTASPMSYRFPGESSAEAFQQAQDMNYRRQTLEYNNTPSRHRRAVSSAAAIVCPPSPDDHIFYGRRHSVAPVDEATPLGISSSSDQLPSGLSESTSHPSIPSVISGASSLSATIEPDDYLAPIKEASPPTTLPSHAFYSRQRASLGDNPIHHPTPGRKQTLFDDDEAGWNGDGEQESDSEDEGLEMGGQRKVKWK